VSASPIVVLIIGLGYILNSHQIVHNCYIGMTRILVAMSLDRVLPEWFSKSMNATIPCQRHLAYFLASIPIILAYNLIPTWVGLTLVLLSLRLRLHYHLPGWCPATLRAKEVYEASQSQVHRKRLCCMLFTLLGVFASS